MCSSDLKTHGMMNLEGMVESYCMLSMCWGPFRMMCMENYMEDICSGVLGSSLTMFRMGNVQIRRYDLLGPIKALSNHKSYNYHWNYCKLRMVIYMVRMSSEVEIAAAICHLDKVPRKNPK